MREDGGYGECIIEVYSTTKDVDVVIDKAQAVHTRVELYVYRVVCTLGTMYRVAELIQRAIAIYLWLEVVGNHHIETVVVGIEHHDRHSDTLRT